MTGCLVDTHGCPEDGHMESQLDTEDCPDVGLVGLWDMPGTNCMLERTYLFSLEVCQLSRGKRN